MAKSLLEELSADDPLEKGPAPSPKGSADPYADMMTRAREAVPEAIPGWLRTIGRALIPQTTPELAATGAMAALQPETVFLPKGPILGALARMGLTGAATAGAGALTGYSPLESGITGTVGAGGGELVRGVAGKALQQWGTSRSMEKARGLLSERFRDLFRDFLPAKATDEAILADVIAGGPRQRIGARMGALTAAAAKTPLSVAGGKALAPDLLAAGVIDEGDAKGVLAGGRLAFGPIWSKVKGNRALEGRVLDALDPAVAKEYAGLQQAYGQASGVQAWLQGIKHTKEVTGESGARAIEVLTDPEGRLSIGGRRLLTARLAGGAQPGIPAQARRDLGTALDWEPGMGGARPEPGQSAELYASTHLSGLPRIGMHLPRAAWTPDWQAQIPSGLEPLATRAVPALLSGVPSKMLPTPRKANRAEPEEE